MQQSKIKVTKYEVSEVTVERASNGWIVTSKYDRLYEDAPKSDVCRTIPEMLEAVKKYASTPHTRQEQEW